jgi:integrase
MTKHLIPRFGDRPLSEVTTQEIQSYVTHLTKAGYAPKSIDHIHDVLSAILRSAVKWGHLQVNPTQGVEMPRLKTVRPKWALTTDQASALLDQVASPLARTLAGLALLTGVRRGELFALRWQDVDEQQRGLQVRAAVYEGVFDDPKTKASLRTIPLPEAAMSLLQAWQARTARTGPLDLIFATVSGKPISPNNVLRRAIWPACLATGLPRVTWLTLRRTYSSWAHDKGVPGKVIAQLMGHAKVDTTMNVYTQVLDGAARSAADRVGSELFRIVQKSGEGAERVH